MTDIITLAHGAGGELYREMVEEIFAPAFSNEYISPLNDSAVVPVTGKIAMTTDSFVIEPLFFPGGDIGRLSVCGTVNDLSVSGAKPEYLTLGMIIEAGFETEKLVKICKSIAETAAEAGVKIVTGDTKVVEGGKGDGIYINTAGVGVFDENHKPFEQKCHIGDVIICSGKIASHGTSVLVARTGFEADPAPVSDARPLNSLIETAAGASGKISAMRDPTRGGAACTLCEWAKDGIDIQIDSSLIPVDSGVKELLGIFGMDALSLANEGVVLVSVPEAESEKVLGAMQKHPYGTDACIIGKVTPGTGKVFEVTEMGTKRRVLMPAGEILPRIC